MPLVARLFVGALLVCVGTFCTFGFLAAYEPGIPTAMTWRVGYGLAIAASLIAAVWIVGQGTRRD